MGLEWFDTWSLLHFSWGIIIPSILYPENPLISVIICNLLHLVTEYMEHDTLPNGQPLTSTINHVTDILFFFMGSMFSLFFIRNYFVKDVNSRIIFLFATLFALIIEVGREIYPETFWISPAFHGNRYFGKDIN
jgi:hypothetical protein